MTSPGGPGLYGMTDAHLVSIINATRDHADQMHKLRANVEAQANVYIRANNSESGQIMTQRLNEWTQNFHRTVGHLEQLNEKVHNVRRNNLAANTDASGLAGGSFTGG
jgi:hypothetical protein